MRFERVNVSPELVAIVGWWLVTLVLFWDYNKDKNDYRAEMRSGIGTFRAGTSGEIANSRAEVLGRLVDLEERMARIESLHEGYIARSRTEGEATATE